MKPSESIPHAPGAPNRSQRAGFTLAELIVAVGAVALLTIGIGQIFSSVNKLVGTGAAIAETDQMARAIEARMREDFSSLSRLRAEDTFFAIRNRKVRNIYLNRDQRDLDRRAGLNETSVGTAARTRRIDEMMFLAFGGEGGGYASAQLAPSGQSGTVSASVARIYYGHALRPQPDPDYNPENPVNGNVPARQWLPDGDFGQRAGDINRFQSGVPVVGRNEFAGDWLLVRQPLLLYGSLASGPPAGSNARPPIPTGLAYAPYLRDLDTRARIANVGESMNDSIWPRGGQWQTYPRLLSRGRVDICAQSPETLKRWLEGVDPAPPLPRPPGWRPPDATAFDSGLLNQVPSPDNPYLTASGVQWDSPLWQRIGGATNPDTQRANTWGLQGAIAGAFTRYLAESDPPLVDRGDSPDGSGMNQPVNQDPALSALMDLHATIATRCSNFEIAWSDGTTWLYDTTLTIDSDNDGVPEVRLQRGDVVWFDMNFFRRRGPGGNDDLSDGGRDRVYPTQSQEPLAEKLPGPNIQTIERFPTGANREAYLGGNVGATGDRATVNAAAPDRNDEYLAIWGYRLPDVAGGFSGPWPKPKLIRVRMTLHDSQYRIEGGRQYEFIFAVNLK